MISFRIFSFLKFKYSKILSEFNYIFTNTKVFFLVLLDLRNLFEFLIFNVCIKYTSLIIFLQWLCK